MTRVAAGDEVPPPGPLVEAGAGIKQRSLEHHRGVDESLDPPPSPYFRVEDLPKEIQYLIVSRLPLKEAVRTSIVSRSWRKHWTFCRDLFFDGTENPSTYRNGVKTEPAKFIATVNSIIQQHSGIGLRKFCIRCDFCQKRAPHLDKWINFAAASKGKTVLISLRSKGNVTGPAKEFYRFPLETFGDGSVIQSLLLANVSIQPQPGICDFVQLKRLLLHFVKIIGDLPDLLSKCSVLEDLELKACSGVADLNVPHQLDKLRHLLISDMVIQTIDFHVTGLTRFCYQGDVIPIYLHGCSKLGMAKVTFRGGHNALSHAFTMIPGISAVKVLKVHADTLYRLLWDIQSRKLLGHTPKEEPPCTFLHLRHLICEIKIPAGTLNRHDGMIQLACYMDCAPQLETLQLHMRFPWYYASIGNINSEATEEGGSSPMRRHDRLRAVHMSGFRCLRAQVVLLGCILDNAPALEHATIQPEITMSCAARWNHDVPVSMIRQWAERAEKRYGKVITVIQEARRQER